MREGEHYQLKVDQFKLDGHNGLQFFRYISKNNQREIHRGEAQIISISGDDMVLVQTFSFIYLNVHLQSMKIFICNPIHTGQLAVGIEQLMWEKID